VDLKKSTEMLGHKGIDDLILSQVSDNGIGSDLFIEAKTSGN